MLSSIGNTNLKMTEPEKQKLEEEIRILTERLEVLQDLHRLKDEAYFRQQTLVEMGLIKTSLDRIAEAMERQATALETSLAASLPETNKK